MQENSIRHKNARPAAAVNGSRAERDSRCALPAGAAGIPAAAALAFWIVYHFIIDKQPGNHQSH